MFFYTLSTGKVGGNLTESPKVVLGLKTLPAFLTLGILSIPITVNVGLQVLLRYY